MSPVEEFDPPHAYASTTHVEALNQGRPPFTASSNPSLEDVKQWLAETAGVIDGLLRQKGYEVPVSPTAASTALKTLENFNAAGAAYFVERAAKTSDRRKEAKEMWDWAQKMLADGIIELGLPIDAEESLPRGGFGRTGPAATPFFTRSMEL